MYQKGVSENFFSVETTSKAFLRVLSSDFPMTILLRRLTRIQQSNDHLGSDVNLDFWKGPSESEVLWKVSTTLYNFWIFMLSQTDSGNQRSVWPEPKYLEFYCTKKFLFWSFSIYCSTISILIIYVGALGRLSSNSSNSWTLQLHLQSYGLITNIQIQFIREQLGFYVLSESIVPFPQSLLELNWPPH